MTRQTSSSRMATDMQELRDASALQWADTKAQITALVSKLSCLDEAMYDSNVVMENQRATIRAFAEDAMSILTSSLVEPGGTPSPRVSTLYETSTRSESFVTAYTSATLQNDTPKGKVYPQQLLIRGIGSGTTVVRGSESGVPFTHGLQLLVAVEQTLLIPERHFWLTYAGKVIRETTDLSCVPHDATVFAYYRAQHMRRVVAIRPPAGRQEIVVLRYGSTFEPTVADLQSEIEDRFHIPRDQQRIVADGRQLGPPHLTLESFGISTSSSNPGHVHLDNVLPDSPAPSQARMPRRSPATEPLSGIDEEDSDDENPSHRHTRALNVLAARVKEGERAIAPKKAVVGSLRRRIGARALIPTWRRPSRWAV